MSQEIISLQGSDALVVVDVQNDFCPGGALPIPQGDEVVPVANSWIRAARDRGIPVYCSRDFHPREHPSFEEQGGAWPQHCIQETWGAEFHSDLEVPENARIVTKGVRFDKDQNSIFDETGLASHLEREGIRRLIVLGLALDVCVRASVLDGLEAGFDIFLILDGCRAVTEESGRETIQELERAGANCISGASS
jgi:nicotinamidase/pyrazinamidase